MLYLTLILLLIICNEASNNLDLSFQNNVLSKKRKRAIVVDLSKKFKSPLIRYHIDSTLNFHRVVNALNVINHETCLSFYPSPSSEKVDIIYKHNSFYDSSLGMEKNPFHVINIGSKNPTKKQILRFTLRSLGIDFEHNRYDRNRYVSVIHENIEKDFKHYFNLQKYHLASTYGLRYDYMSIMHFTYQEYSFNFKSTLETNDKLIQQSMGNSQEPTFNDFKLLNIHYCSKACRKKLVCLNHGYTDPTNCEKCKCPPFYTGKFCENFAKNGLLCYKTQIFKAKKKPQTISLYLHGDCQYIIESNPGKRIHFKTIARRPKWKFGCGSFEEYIEVRYLTDKSVSGIFFCSYWNSIEKFSGDNYIFIRTKFTSSKKLFVFQFSEY